ncbi:MAG: PH domain-containing protein [Verrucomicrobiota bacterium]
MKTYKAPWSVSLIIISTLTTALCMGFAGTMIVGNRWVHPRWIQLWPAVLSLVLIIRAALFTIRGYTITTDALLIHRLFWKTRLPLAGLRSARHEPYAMRRSLRTWGPDGVFSFTGEYNNKALGIYRAFVTDKHRTVVLKFSDRRKVVVSPEKPEEFAHEIGLYCAKSVVVSEMNNLKRLSDQLTI